MVRRFQLAHLWLWALLVVIPAVTLSAQPAESDRDLKTGIKEHFAELKKSFDRIASSPSAKKTKLYLVDRLFVSALKSNQAFYTLLRVNSKGIVINEVIRGQTTERNYRSVDKQLWFSYVQKNRKEYHGFLKEDNGRYYLFWSAPYFYRNRSGRQRFGGAVVVKVDLWDVIHEYSDKVDVPFLVRIYGKTLYSHKWNDIEKYSQESLEIPGIDKITVRFPPRVSEMQKQQARTDSLLAAATKAEQPAAQKTATPSAKTKSPVSFRVIIGVGAILAIVLTIALARILIWFKHWRLMRKIDKEESIF